MMASQIASLEEDKKAYREQVRRTRVALVSTPPQLLTYLLNSSISSNRNSEMIPEMPNFKPSSPS